MGSVKSIALIGIGGYGAMYCSAFMDPRLKDYPLKAVVDPNPSGSKFLPAMRQANTAIFTSVDEFLKSTRVDLAVVASPIQFHSVHTAEILRQGTHVLCEKPLCTTLEEATQMLAARDRAGKQVTIGYQWSFSKAIQRLKSDVAAGVLGKPKRLRTLVLWPRTEAYYKRNDWAGAVFDARGNPVYDSPVQNACAHFLHNMFFVLGSRPDESGSPCSVLAETYRAYDIGNYDTAAIRCHSSAGVEIIFIASHASGKSVGPMFSYEFENATVRYDSESDDAIVAEFRDGSIKNYGSPEESHYQKLFAAIETAETGAMPLCGIESALPQIQVMLATQQSRDHVVSFPKSLVNWQPDLPSRKIEVEGLGNVLQQCYEKGCLPSELGIEWAVAGREVNVSPMGAPIPVALAGESGAAASPQLSYKVYVKRRPAVGTSEEMGSH